MAEPQVHFRDFTKKRLPIRFKIGDIEYRCVKSLPPVKLQTLITAVKKDDTNETNAIERISAAFKIAMKPASYATFAAQLDASNTDGDDDDDNDNEIDIEQLGEILQWLLGKYTDRPTKPSSSSSTGSPSDDGGTSSTAGQPPLESGP